ncbi:MAG TPA: hypothetical protein VGI61_03505 [Parafilimonas sp.]
MKIFILAFLFLALFSCKKNNSVNTKGKIKIQVISGNNQHDTVGRILKDSIKILVSLSGQPLPKTPIRIIQNGCTKIQQSFLITGENGIASFSWMLNSTNGQQSLNIYALDSLENIVDSTTADAEGLIFDHGWMPCDCIPDGNLTNMIQLDDGRLLIAANNMLYSSSNNGISWNSMKSFPDQAFFNNIVAFHQNIFLQNGQIIMYSTDGGATWQSMNSIANFGNFVVLRITAYGKLFLSTGNGVYMSLDLGKTWVNISTLAKNWLGYSSFYDVFSESTTGTLYAVNNNQELWTSADTGASWFLAFGLDQVTTVFADEKGNLYLGKEVGADQSGIFKLDKSSNTWTALNYFQDKPGREADIENITEVNHNFYFTVADYGLMKTSDFTAIQQITPFPVGPYCVTSANAIVTPIVALNGWAYNLNP